MTPNPGSKEAIAQGCTCFISTEREYPYSTMVAIHLDCPLHNQKEETDEQ